jgi:hypothetical protein
VSAFIPASSQFISHSSFSNYAVRGIPTGMKKDRMRRDEGIKEEG